MQRAKSRRCAAPGCHTRFEPDRPFIRHCSDDCGAALGILRIEKAKAAKAKAERKVDKAKKDGMKRRADWIADAQKAFNAWVRARDIAAGHGCIDCGKPFEPMKPGGSIDAGHYLARGGSPHLKFDERNCFAQRKNCNRPGGTTREAFRKGVEARIGTEALEALESDQESRDMSIDDLKEIIAKYRGKLKEVKAAC